MGSKDGSIISLLGASPGASTAAKVMIEVMKRAYPEQVKSSKWNERLRMIFPAFDQVAGKTGKSPDSAPR